MNDNDKHPTQPLLSRMKLSIGETAYKKAVFYLLSGNSGLDLADMFMEVLYSQKTTTGTKLNDFISEVLAEETANRKEHESDPDRNETAFEPFEESFDKYWEDNKFAMSNPIWE